VLEEGVLLAIEEERYIPTQRRDPEGVPLVEPVRQVNEPLEIPRALDFAYGRGVQTTPSSRPMLAN
jgi:hypothetical protein